MSNSLLGLTRDQLAEFLPNARAVRAFEQLLLQVSKLIPGDIAAITTAMDDFTSSLAGADARTNQVADAINKLADAVDLLANAPAISAVLPEPALQTTAISAAAQDDLTPPVVIGSLGLQQANSVAITGGAVACKLTNNQTTLLASSTTLTNAAGALTATLTNSPVTGNPTKWVNIDDNGTTRRLPLW